MIKIILILGVVCALFSTTLFSTTLFGANSVLKELDLDLKSLYNEIIYFILVRPSARFHPIARFIDGLLSSL